MKLPFSEPEPAGSERARLAKALRDLATETSRLQPQALTLSNAEETDHGAPYPANFTKGLAHDKNGLVSHDEDYPCFVEAINAPDPTLFEKSVETAESREVTYHYETKDSSGAKEDVEWRGWESPRAGHVYELQGMDSGAVGMAPAPRVGSSELAAEMAEVYGLAILRDVPFTTICAGGGDKIGGAGKKDGKAVLDAKSVVDAINKMPFFSGKGVKSSTPHQVDDSKLNRFERNRRFARTQSLDGKLTPATAFRGSTPGALEGPYLSQFMLIGANSLAGKDGGVASFPGVEATFDLQDGFIPYGTLVVDQRTITAKACLDYMTDWSSWLDVQNGASFGCIDVYEPKRRFITTPRDLATYVHFDALYEAYLNAALLMLAMRVPGSKGFPETSPSGHRTGFATFGGPHILSLVTEVATRCLKAVRRQKFNYHRRCRPEAIGGRLTLANLGFGGKMNGASAAFQATLDEISPAIQKAIVEHNALQNAAAMAKMRNLHETDTTLPDHATPAKFKKMNLLLPMAFPEGSPMHPAYGAGHATVAGGCVTMLKSFFEMFEENDSFVPRKLQTEDCAPIAYVPKDDGSALKKDNSVKTPLTIQGNSTSLRPTFL